MHLSILSKDCPWWGHYFLIFFPLQSLYSTPNQPELYFDAKSSRTRTWCPGANVYAWVLRRAVYLQWGNERAVTSPLWMRCNTAELLEGFNWGGWGAGGGTFLMRSIVPSAGHRAGDGQNMISWSVNMINRFIWKKWYYLEYDWSCGTVILVQF